MGFYAEYLDRNLSFEEMTTERKKQLARIAEIRQRDVLVYAADFNKSDVPISMVYSDLLPFQDQLANLHGDEVDLILETPGGSGEVAEDIVRLLRNKFKKSVAAIIPGWAKSAGTIMAMAADEILMDPYSALGPIDAQLTWQGKTFSAHALLEGMEKIKSEVIVTGRLNLAYVPILQGISPGELQTAENAQNFAKKLVTEWLAKYKFQNWNQHSSDGSEVTEEQKRKRAEEIAEELCDHGKWLTHARSIKIDDLQTMRLLITDMSAQPELCEAVRRYYTLVQMLFASNVYKLFETPTSQIYRWMNMPMPMQQVPVGNVAHIAVKCAKCQSDLKVQANLGEDVPLQDGCVPFPAGNRLTCPKCGNEIDLAEARRQVEGVAKKPILTPKEG